MLDNTILRYSNIIPKTEVDGPGVRAAIFFQGCPIHCSGCQNFLLWDEYGGRRAPTSKIAKSLLATGRNVTITGGEPFYQPEALAELVMRLKMADRHIIVYTGYDLADLLEMSLAIPEIMVTLALADVLVDGPYVSGLDHDAMQWRGSSNQRAIDLRATRDYEGGCWGDPVLLDWDTPMVTINEDGDLLAAADIADLFSDLGAERESRRCGETSAAPAGHLWLRMHD